MLPKNVIGIVYGFYIPPQLEDLPAPCGVLELFGDQLKTWMPPEEYLRWLDICEEASGRYDENTLRGHELYRVLMEALDYLHATKRLRIHTNMLWLGVGVSVGGWTKDDRGNGKLPTGEAGRPLPLTSVARKARQTLDKDSKRLINTVGNVVGKRPEWILLDTTY